MYKDEEKAVLIKFEQINLISSMKDTQVCASEHPVHSQSSLELQALPNHG